MAFEAASQTLQWLYINWMLRCRCCISIWIPLLWGETQMERKSFSQLLKHEIVLKKGSRTQFVWNLPNNELIFYLFGCLAANNCMETAVWVAVQEKKAHPRLGPFRISARSTKKKSRKTMWSKKRHCENCRKMFRDYCRITKKLFRCFWGRLVKHRNKKCS